MGDPVSMMVVAAGASTASGLFSASGQAQATSYQSAQAAVAARRGKIAAAETDTTLRQNLQDTIGNIRAIRASAGIDPNSPTTQAIIASESAKSERSRRIQVANAEAQVAADEWSSRTLSRISGDQWLYGSLGALAGGAGSFAKMAA
jgi:hypothetical protein